MYNALVLLHFNYCSTVWHDGNNSIIDNLFKLQKRAPRIITGPEYEIRSVEIFNNLKWSPIINTLNKRELMMYKLLKGLAPNYLTQLFNICDNKYYNLWSKNTNLTLKKPKTNFLRRSFSYRGAVCWNRLDENIVRNINTITLKTFKISYAKSE